MFFSGPGSCIEELAAYRLLSGPTAAAAGGCAAAGGAGAGAATLGAAFPGSGFTISMLPLK